MAKGERRRRRKEDPSTDADGILPAATEAGQSAVPDPAGLPADTPAHDPAAGESDKRESQPGWPDGAPPRPIALAEILVNPDLARSSGVSAPMRTDTPDGPFAEEQRGAREEPPPTPVHTRQFAAAKAPEQVPEPETVSPSSPPYRTDDLSLAPMDDRQRWTREPLLLALLLAALLVLIFDTYCTLRLTGVSDRLALGSGAAAPASAERPWVGVDSIKTATFTNGGQPVTTVHIVNSGHEPAYDLRSNTAGSLRSAATAGPSVPTQKGQLAVTALLLPNVGGNLTFFANTRALTAEEAANVRSGQYVLWLTGRLDYRDPHGHPHLTTFRYRYNPALNSFMASPEGNTAN